MKDETKNKKADIAKSLNIFLIQYFHVLTIFIIGVFVVLSFFFLLKPKYDNIQRRNEISNENKKNEKEALQAYDKKLDGYINSYNKISDSDKEKINKLLPSEDKKELLFVRFEELTKKWGLLMPNLNISVEEVAGVDDTTKTTSAKIKKTSALPKGIGIVSISVDVVGLNYEDFKDFISVIENNLRIMSIDNLSYSNENKSLSLNIRTFFNYFDKL